MEDILKLLANAWVILTGLISFVVAVGNLFLRMSRTEEDLKLIKQEIKTAREDAKADIQSYIDMEKAEHVIIISRFESGLSKIETKIDKLMDYNLEQANRHRAE